MGEQAGRQLTMTTTMETIKPWRESAPGLQGGVQAGEHAGRQRGRQAGRG